MTLLSHEALVKQLGARVQQLVDQDWEDISLGENIMSVYTPDQVSLESIEAIAGLAFSEEGFETVYVIAADEVHTDHGETLTDEELQKLCAKFNLYHVQAMSEAA